MPQAVEVETQSEQESLARLHPERATGRASRELALYRRERCFDQGAAPVEPSRERPPHLGTHSAHPPGFLATLGGNHALGAEPLTDISVIPLAVELGVGWEAASTMAGKFAPSFHGPRRARCESRNC